MYNFYLSTSISYFEQQNHSRKIDRAIIIKTYRIMAIRTNENFTPFSNSVAFRKPRGMDLVTASEMIPGFCRSKSNVPTPGSLRTIKSPTGGKSQASNPRPLPALPPPPTGFTLIGAL